MKIFIAVLAAILVAYAVIHSSDGKNARLQESLRLSRKAYALDEPVMNEMDAKLKNTGPVRSRNQLPVAKDIRSRAVAHLNEVTTNPFAGTEEPGEVRNFIAVTDSVIAELTRTAATPNPTAYNPEFKLDLATPTPAPKQSRLTGSALDKPAR